ncbi:MAG TPA: zinc ribbon domain-containing protein [Candidatus Thermoplasmatota archaeon]|jgi:hypothetical protein|nr:zinc ribbon domain-containing protein [Candidatus Thermoplasmatota archaeon]
MDAGRIRSLHLASLAAAVVLAIVGLFLLTGASNAGARLVIILVLVVLIGLEVWLYREARRVPSYAVAEEPLTAPAMQRMTIRCKQCGEVFPVEDTGARPLIAACPHCGKSGTIKVRTDAGAE